MLKALGLSVTGVRSSDASAGGRARRSCSPVPVAVARSDRRDAEVPDERGMRKRELSAGRAKIWLERSRAVRSRRKSSRPLRFSRIPACPDRSLRIRLLGISIALSRNEVRGHLRTCTSPNDQFTPR